MKRTRRLLSLVALASAVSLLGAACGDDKDDASTDSGSETKSEIKVGLAYDLGGRGDKSFNDAAAAGLDEAKKELGVTGKELSPSSDEDREANLKLLAEGEYNPIIGVGFAYADSIKLVAEANPDVTFGTIDTVVDLPNVHNNVFAENEGSFLVGAAAGLKTKSNKVGFIGGVETELIKKFEAGFVAGVKETNPTATVEVKYITPDGDFSGFNAPDKAKEIAGSMYDGGADVIFHAAGGSGTGLFDAAVAAGDGKWAIGVDSDQYLGATADQQKHILTSMLKRVDVAVRDTIKAFADGDTKGKTVVLDLKADGVGYSTSGGYVDDIADQLDALKEKIIAGDITVPEAP
ncbi:MAG TPA: BMP family ABC transporter substrate-binding protein [Microthrixaceae bacterium]|nr:BMP family ABC transporter substrate-binding protein [Microthrixaceae bacterium]